MTSAPAPGALSPTAPSRPLAPETLHPALWHAHQLGGGRIVATASGFAALDAELPGGGWPHRMLTELLLPHPGLGELRLLAPALAALLQPAAAHGEAADDGGRCVMLFDPPAGLCGWALAQLGVDARRLVVVHGREGRKGATYLRHLLPSADVLWALEQSLRSGHLGAALAWLPARLTADVLRRLQLAAQAHDGPVFLFREAEARQRPSAAPLRLALQPAGFDTLSVKLLKRRGPPLAEALRLQLPPVLEPDLRGRTPAQLLRAARAGRSSRSEQP
ncbi:translesion DNA synthesis-associated protein ImuA [Aquincola sp. S2]|uniref:Translesion DNA synthesis-associated protein ImuA n=1 Tax=Pseudaquabacterium terrae TaxID=2732868 RepID=A0ABX2EJL4_9BURK|nr:translesion DNA synthesis-associated protein ImuA [Aquabacterium terrae]